MRHDRLKKITDDAATALWKSVADACPEASSGDLPPEVELTLREALADAVKNWVLCNAVQLPPEGARIRMTTDVDRFPHFIVKAGMTGVVEESATTTPISAGIIVRFDQYIEGCEEWKNRVIWQEDDDVLDVPDVMEVTSLPEQPPKAPGDYVVRVVRRTSEHVDVPVEGAADAEDAKRRALAVADKYLERNKDCDVEVDVAFVEPDPESERTA